LLKRKFQELARKKVPTGDPNCPLTFAMPSVFSIRLYRLLMGRHAVLMVR
jgi:hypothetical protein